MQSIQNILWVSVTTISVIISLSTIAHDTYPLITAGGELALAICSATLDPPATDGSHSTNV